MPGVSSVPAHSTLTILAAATSSLQQQPITLHVLEHHIYLKYKYSAAQYIKTCECIEVLQMIKDLIPEIVTCECDTQYNSFALCY